MANPEKYAKRLEQKIRANAKRRLNKEKAKKDAICKINSQRKLRAQIKELRQKLKEKQELLTDEQYKLVFTKNGSHYKCNSVRVLEEILNNIEEAK